MMGILRGLRAWIDPLGELERRQSLKYDIDGDIRVLTHPADKGVPIGFGVFVNDCMVARLPHKRVQQAYLTFSDMVRAYQDGNKNARAVVDNRD